jgi:hypothetical protein
VAAARGTGGRKGTSSSRRASGGGIGRREVYRSGWYQDWGLDSKAATAARRAAIRSNLDELEKEAIHDARRIIELRDIKELYIDLFVDGCSSPRRCRMYDPFVIRDLADDSRLVKYLEVDRKRPKKISPHFSLVQQAKPVDKDNRPSFRAWREDIFRHLRGSNIISVERLERVCYIEF